MARGRSGGGELSSLAAPKQPDRYIALDSLRGIAALGVAAYHLHGGGALFDLAVVRGGWLWVDFFFVLSGFVISSSYGERLAQDFSLARFMLLRLGRVWPLHINVLAFYVAIELARWLVPVGDLANRGAFVGSHSPGLMLATAALVQVWLPDTEAWSPVSWSISVEIALYLAIALVWRMARARGWIVALIAGVVSAVVLAAFHELPTNVWQISRGVAGFGLGVACQRWYLTGLTPRGTLAELACVTALGMVLGGWVPVSFELVAADAVFVATVAVFAAERGRVSHFLRANPCVLLGTLSYSIYLVHLAVIGRGIDALRLVGLGRLVAVPEGIQHHIAAPAPLDSVLGIVLLATCIPVAWCTWRWIEVPARNWSRRHAARMGPQPVTPSV